MVTYNILSCILKLFINLNFCGRYGTGSRILPARPCWRAAGEETRPKPKEGEVVVLLDHITRGMCPPGSNFFRRVLAYYELTPLDLSPNSVLNICTFAVYCEVFLQIKPNLSLFLESFYCNPQNKKGHAMGPYGGVAIQRCRSASLHFPSLTLASHPKGWHNTYFYCKDTTPLNE